MGQRFGHERGTDAPWYVQPLHGTLRGPPLHALIALIAAVDPPALPR